MSGDESSFVVNGTVHVVIKVAVESTLYLENELIDASKH